MNKELKAQWLAALRSGDFKQTTAALHDESGYCCLGVLCKIGTGRDPIEADTREGEELLSDELADEFGLDYEDQQILAKMNDGNLLEGIEGHSFLEIADYIERTL